MKNICKIAVLLAAVLMIFCVTGCGDTAGGTPTGGGEDSVPEERKVPLTLEAMADGTITLTNPWSTLKYKKNDGDFVNVTASANTVSVAAGDKITFYAEGSENNISQNVLFKIDCSSDCYVYGNVMSLLSSSDFKNVTSISTQHAFAGLFDGNTHIKSNTTKKLVLPATTLSSHCYYIMFYGCTGLTGAPSLPATTLAEGCYKCMFWGCTGLTSAPALPATTLANECYVFMFSYCTNLTSAPSLPAMTLTTGGYCGMFFNCSGLTSAPALPATTLAQNCYCDMFNGCTSLAGAPSLPATTLANNCYYRMFSGCTSLASVTCLATNISAENCTYNWLDNAGTSATSRTFYYNAQFNSNEADTFWNSSRIPNGWTKQPYSAPQQ